jgi:hypothetical protein
MRLMATAIVLAASAAPALAQDDNIGVRYRLWQADIEGEVRADDGGLFGDLIDIEQTLDVEQDVTINNIGGWIGLPFVGRIIVDYWWGEFEGEETLDRSITFAGQTFDIGENVEATLDWQILTGVYEFSFKVPLSSDVLGLRVGLRAGIKGGTLEFTIRSSLTGEESIELDGGIPVIGASAELFFGGYFSVSVEVDGMGVSSEMTGGWSGSIIDYAVALRGNFKPLFIGAGYRSIALDVDDEDTDVETVEGDLEISGFFGEVGVRF